MKPELSFAAIGSLPSAAAIVIFVASITAVVFYWRQVFRGNPFLVFLLLLVTIYTVILWTQNYGQYLETGRPVAINGRYYIPLLLPLAVVFGRALGVALEPWKNAKIWIAAAAILFFWQGGGVFSFILRSDSAWYWPNPAVTQVNSAAQKVLDPVMYEGPKVLEPN